ncbi:hypothetical protein [Pseudorhodobacter wandonensis]|uniref:hypothetical protein n=1 Tax=Pseudorhodobacter wandonensis TaxID=1120568 RepID=UPI00067B033C|nr:hypothetical protein [Pseudorhodobacter wandonensis]
MQISPNTPSATPVNFAAYGPGFGCVLASMQTLSDAGHAACPQAWSDLTNLLHILIEDEGMTTEMAAWEATVPESLVADYRQLVGI